MVQAASSPRPAGAFQLPAVSVIVCTRDRVDQLEPALKTILESLHRDFELIVIDQSTGPETKALCEALAAADKRVAYHKDPGKGLSRARNIGLSLARHEIIIFTDDDCQPKPNWLSVMTEALTRDKGAGLAYGAVVPAPCDPVEGFIVGFTPTTRERLTGRLAKLRDAGIGASMGLRREVIDRVGPFDEMLGAGGPLYSAEDIDMTYRVLAAGYAVLHIPEAIVIHYGLRDWQSGSQLIAKTYEGVGAALAKPLRRGEMVALVLLAQQIGMAFANIGIAMIRMRKPFGFRRALGLFAGIKKGLQLEVGAGPLLYVAPKS